MEELIARVAAAADIPADQAEKAIGIVFAFIRKETPDHADEMLRAIPGAEAAAANGEQAPSGGGLMGGLMGAMNGGGGLLGLASKLSGIGLGTGEMTTVGKEIFAFARETVGDAQVSDIAHSIPGLGQFI